MILADRVLQRTSISTNIKERLDFSCALFGPDGGLVANAPHIPVHLGAMQETVQYQVGCKKYNLCFCDEPLWRESHYCRVSNLILTVNKKLIV